MRSGIVYSIVILISALIIPFVRFYLQGFLTPVYKICPNNRLPSSECCTRIESSDLLPKLSGTEDIAIDSDLEIAFISSGNLLHKSRDSGKILSYDLKSKTLSQVELKMVDTQNFLPHGLSLQINKSASGEIIDRFLYVVNHEKEYDTVLKLKVLLLKAQKGIQPHIVLEQIDQYQSVLFTSLNDVVATNQYEFFVTNDHSVSLPLGMYEDIYQLKKGSVVRCLSDQKKAQSLSCSIVVDGLSFPNGINANFDLNTLYVTSSALGILHTFKVPAPILESDGKLVPNEYHELFQEKVYHLGGSFLDNIDVDQITGNLHIGTHVSVSLFANHAGSETSTLSPTQILLVEVDNEGIPIADKVVFMSDGHDLSAGATGVHQPLLKRLLIGAVHDNVMLDCDTYY